MGNDLNQAQARINALLDENSFVELQSLVTSRSTDFNLDAKKEPSDGVIIGHGLVDGTLVFVFSQNADVLGGTIGEMHAKKILSVYDMALKVGAPVIGFIDCGGVRLQESFDALEALGSVIERAADVKGVIPQLMCVAGQCGGGLSVLPALADFTFMVDGASLFINSPDAITGNSADKCDTSSAEFQFNEAGTVDVHGSLDEVVSSMRQVISMIPNDIVEASDDLNRAAADIASFVGGDIAGAVAAIADNGSVFESKADFAKDVFTGLIKLNGDTVGVIANNDTAITANGAAKAADFVEFLDAFEIPVLTLTNVEKFKNCMCCEKRFAREGAKLTAAFANATVPKVNVIVGKAFGTPGVMMNSKALGADMTFAWADAKIGMIDSKYAAQVIAGDKGDKDAVAKEYDALQNSVDAAARRGYVDTIINAEDTRKYVIGAFDMLYTKAVDTPAKKHTTK